MTDEQLVRRCKNQDPKAQRILYEKFSRKMFGVCLRYCNNREDAEDLLQEGFVRVFSRLSSYKGDGSLEGWIRKVMVNTALDQFRKNKVNWTISIDEAEDTADFPDNGKFDANAIVQLISKLPEGFRMVFNLYAIEGFNHREIGEMLNISEGTSKSQFSRARAQLIKEVTQLYGIKPEVK